MLKKFVVGALIGGAAMCGIAAGSGTAEAKIEPGHYKAHYVIYGIIPMPEYNVTVIGNRAYSDFYGAGRWNQYTSTITPTRNGGIIARNNDPVTSFVQRDEYTHRTKNGYRGTTYGYGIPTGDAILKKTTKPRR